MNRRDLIKLSTLAVAGTSLCGLTGCNNKESQEITAENDADKIIPKQTSRYEISSPLPLKKELIDELYDFNKTLKKSKITTLYTSIPSPLSGILDPFFQCSRGYTPHIKTLADYTDIIKYAMKKKFKCVYALNNTAVINNFNNAVVMQSIKDLFETLYISGLRDVKIANPHILEYFSKELPKFNLHVSTSSEYHGVQVYQHLINEYPTIKSINISTDENHNFEFLKSLKTLFPKIKIELLVNEINCTKYCISRCYHPSTVFFGFNCSKFMRENKFLNLCRTNIIHPWELVYYSAIGINSFKLSHATRNNIHNINHVRYYLDCLENGEDKYSANELISKIHHAFEKTETIKKSNQPLMYKIVDGMFKDDLSLKELKELLPDINYFIKNGSKCASECGTKCRYCYDLANKLEKLYSKNV